MGGWGGGGGVGGGEEGVQVERYTLSSPECSAYLIWTGRDRDGWG